MAPGSMPAVADIRLSTTKSIEPQAIDNLRSTVGWDARGDKWHEVLEKSQFVATMWDGDRLVAFGRLVEDGVMCMFYDLVVDREYQAQGLGWKLGRVLIDQVKDKGYRSIGLFAAEDPRLRRGYERAGFVPADGAMLLERYMVDSAPPAGE